MKKMPQKQPSSKKKEKEKRCVPVNTLILIEILLIRRKHYRVNQLIILGCHGLCLETKAPGKSLKGNNFLFRRLKI